MAPVPRQAFFYDSFQGIERFRKALANMLVQTFMKVRTPRILGHHLMLSLARGRVVEGAPRLA